MSSTVRPLIVVTTLLLLCRTSGPAAEPAEESCRVLADRRVEEPVRAIVRDFGDRGGVRVSLEILPGDGVSAAVQKEEIPWDLVISLADRKDGTPPASRLPGARKVAWKYPTGEPVWAAAVGKNPAADRLCRFLGGPTAHLLWSRSKAGFTITSGKTHAEAFQWVAENRVKQTYPLTALRMLGECGGMRDGLCIDLGCGPGHLSVELARRSRFRIIGLDIDPDMKPLFEDNARKAGLQERLSFVQGDAQDLPFPDDHADLIVSRGVLPFIPDLGKCLREVARVLKPGGVAFLGGRYLYTPQSHKMSGETLRRIVREAGIPGASVIEERGQWVKIAGPEAPEGARQFQGGPVRLPRRMIASYRMTEGKCLLICGSDGDLQQALERGFIESTRFDITALYSSEKIARQAEERIGKENLSGRITCKVGKVQSLPFGECSFDRVAGVGPMLLLGDREKGMREIHRVLRPGGVALVGGRFLGMPASRRVSSEDLQKSADATGLRSIRVLDDMGQWVEIQKGIGDWEYSP